LRERVGVRGLPQKGEGEGSLRRFPLPLGERGSLRLILSLEGRG